MLPAPLDRVCVAAGFSGHGFKLSPLVGKIMAGLATGAPPVVDMAHFRLARLLEQQSAIAAAGAGAGAGAGVGGAGGNENADDKRLASRL